MKRKHRIEAIDLFCGIGGLTFGLQEAGIRVVAGLDNDSTCRFSYEKNNKTEFVEGDISDYDFENMSEMYSEGSIRVLVGCAPCQPFSSLTRAIKTKCEKWGLLKQFFRAVQVLKPDVISIENVVGIMTTSVFNQFVEDLAEMGYFVSFGEIRCADYGIPQIRRRMILLASKFDKIEIPESTHSKDEYVTVQDAIGELPHIKAGQTDEKDSMHRTRNLSDLNLERIRNSTPGGTWRDWDKRLLPKCYLKESGKGYGPVYGRMKWDKVAPTITTQFSTYGCGRFGHPEQDRALSVREASIIQTFPKNYIFDKNLGMRTLGCHVGNAVPPKLGAVIGKAIQKHIGEVT